MKLLQKLNKKIEQGLTLIESSMVLAVSAIVIAGVVIYYNKVSVAQRTQSTQALLANIQTAVRSTYTLGSDYTGLTPAMVINTGFIPDMFVKGVTIIHPWKGGQVTIGVPQNNSKTYTVTFTDINNTACQALASLNLGRSLIKLSINSYDVPPGIPTSTKAKACSEFNDNRYSNMTWTFG